MFLDKQHRASCDAELIFDVTKSIFQAPNPSFFNFRLACAIYLDWRVWVIFLTSVVETRFNYFGNTTCYLFFENSEKFFLFFFWLVLIFTCLFWCILINVTRMKIKEKNPLFHIHVLFLFLIYWQIVK